MPATPQIIEVEGIAAAGTRAWRFDLEVAEARLADTMLELVDALSKLPEIALTKP
jgi:hypothetical protein